ncbi:hypothetical protein KPL71_007921 [Citrus sinensis]|uniref:Uncharacterized protein n=2 Tax=Citrus sinensis TaxID=2711 RepID=A0ACB8M339_CITSI|nr:hypothetical protein KPL71_007921 [Citrus sinensis]KDO54211.1 hypothetical protein CISIN_1g025616mg [Citrus sinensis]
MVLDSEEKECHDLTSRSSSSSTVPKLSLLSLPSNNKAAISMEPPGMLTPPIKVLASVPFQWEEAPGKPRPCRAAAGDDGESKPKNVVRCLELPPRLLNEAKVASSGMPSPTTVLDGPYVGGGGRSFRKGGSFRGPAPESTWGRKERVLFGSSRWGSFKKNSNNSKEVVLGIGSGFDFLFPDVEGDAGGDRSYGGGDRCNKDGTRVKMVSKRSVSFRNSISQTKSRFLTSICEGFKQVVPLSWSRRRGRRN